MIGKLVEPGFAPAQGLDVPVEVDVIGALSMAVVANPALVGIFARAPANERGLPDPGVVNWRSRASSGFTRWSRA